MFLLNVGFVDEGLLHSAALEGLLNNFSLSAISVIGQTGYKPPACVCVYFSTSPSYSTFILKTEAA
jgi:hypothetical protein